MTLDDILSSDPHMTKEEKSLRDRFVDEYLKDYSQLNAALRMNYDQEEAVEFAKQIYTDPYVQRSIAEAQTKRCNWLNPSKDNLPQYGVDPEHDKQRIVNRLFEESYAKGAGTSQQGRVSALKELARIYGLGEAEKETATITTNVMVVPAVPSVDDWGKMAQESQEQLKKQVKE